MTAVRASCRAARRSASERDGILGLLAGFEHAKSAALLDAVVDVAPEAAEVLGGGDECADHHQPKQDLRQPVQPRVHFPAPSTGDQDRYGAYLQNHFRLTEGGGFNG